MKQKETTKHQKYLEKLSDPNYQGGSWFLPENPTVLEQTKYDICEQIVVYKQDSKITTEELSQKIKLSKGEAEDILYYRIDYLTLDRLMSYASNLFSPSQVRVIIEKPAKKGNSLLHVA